MVDYDATLLRDHVTLTCRSVDRIFFHAYVPRLQSVGMVCQVLRWQRGHPIPSFAAFGKMGKAYVNEVHKFAKANGMPVRYFAKGEKRRELPSPGVSPWLKNGRSDPEIAWSRSCSIRGGHRRCGYRHRAPRSGQAVGTWRNLIQPWWGIIEDTRLIRLAGRHVATFIRMLHAVKPGQAGQMAQRTLYFIDPRSRNACIRSLYGGRRRALMAGARPE